MNKALVEYDWDDIPGERDAWKITVDGKARIWLDVYCWCGFGMVKVPNSEVKKRLTRPCRVRECRAIDEDMRWKRGVPGDAHTGLHYED